jgi:hypothetical protein
MLRRSGVCAAGINPSVYPFPQPFHDTPYDRQRTDFFPRKASPKAETVRSIKWMTEGFDGTGRGIGIYRPHPLSQLQGNFSQKVENIPTMLNMMMKGVPHRSGLIFYYRGGKPPNPSKHPYLTGEPCPVYGWKVLDTNVTRQFHSPHIEKGQVLLKPYVALHERGILGNLAKESALPSSGSSTSKAVSAAPSSAAKEDKPLLKRLFFWR